MKMEKRTFRIGELAHNLGLESFVIRFWEREFNIESERSEGGQRYYTEADAHTFLRIKELLYDKGLTIAGAKKCLKSGKLPGDDKDALFMTSTRTVIAEKPEAPAQEKKEPYDRQACIYDIKKRLQQLRKTL